MQNMESSYERANANQVKEFCNHDYLYKNEQKPQIFQENMFLWMLEISIIIWLQLCWLLMSELHKWITSWNLNGKLALATCAPAIIIFYFGGRGWDISFGLET